MPYLGDCTYIIQVDVGTDKELYFRCAWELCKNKNQAMRFTEEQASRMLQSIASNWGKKATAKIIRYN